MRFFVLLLCLMSLKMEALDIHSLICTEEINTADKAQSPAVKKELKYGSVIRKNLQIAQKVVRIKNIAAAEKSSELSTITLHTIRFLVRYAHFKKNNLTHPELPTEIRSFFKSRGLPLDSKSTLKAALFVGRLKDENDPENSQIFITPLGEKTGYNYVERELLI